MQIHELPAQTTAADTDVVAIDNGTTTQKMTVANLGKKITEDATPAFTSGDNSEATSWTNVDAVTSGLSLKNILNRITTMMSNVRYLYNLLGTTDITGSGKDTISGAIGGTSISSIGDGTLTGAVGKLNTDLSDFKIVFKSGRITLPAGTAASPSDTSIDISDVRPAGYSAYHALVLLNSYELPYGTNGQVQTRVGFVSDAAVRILNSTSAWTSYTYYMTLICKKF